MTATSTTPEPTTSHGNRAVAYLAPGKVEVQTIDQITLVLRDGREVRWGSADESDLKATVLARLLAAQEATTYYDVSVPGSPTVR